MPPSGGSFGGTKTTETDDPTPPAPPAPPVPPAPPEVGDAGAAGNLGGFVLVDQPVEVVNEPPATADTGRPPEGDPTVKPIPVPSADSNGVPPLDDDLDEPVQPPVRSTQTSRLMDESPASDGRVMAFGSGADGSPAHEVGTLTELETEESVAYGSAPEYQVEPDYVEAGSDLSGPLHTSSIDEISSPEMEDHSDGDSFDFIAG